MATPISKTWLQLQLMSGGATCKEVQQLAEINYPGLSDSTVIDALTWNTQLKTAGYAHLIHPSIIREMSPAQRKTLVIWALQQIKIILPVGWAHTSTISLKIDDIIDCLNTPTAGKRSALQTFASGIAIDYDIPNDRFIRQQIKRMCNLVANQISDHMDVKKTITDLIDIAVLLGQDRGSVNISVLTKMEQIIGIRD